MLKLVGYILAVYWLGDGFQSIVTNGHRLQGAKILLLEVAVAPRAGPLERYGTHIWRCWGSCVMEVVDFCCSNFGLFSLFDWSSFCFWCLEIWFTQWHFCLWTMDVLMVSIFSLTKPSKSWLWYTHMVKEMVSRLHQPYGFVHDYASLTKTTDFGVPHWWTVALPAMQLLFMFSVFHAFENQVFFSLRFSSCWTYQRKYFWDFQPGVIKQWFLWNTLMWPCLQLFF